VHGSACLRPHLLKSAVGLRIAVLPGIHPSPFLATSAATAYISFGAICTRACFRYCTTRDWLRLHKNETRKAERACGTGGRERDRSTNRQIAADRRG
jgi:hypothetical protein